MQCGGNHKQDVTATLKNVKIRIIAIVVFLASSLLVGLVLNARSNVTEAPQLAEQIKPEIKAEEPETIPEPQTLRIIATGDMLPHDTVNLRAKTSSGYDYTQFFEPIQAVFDSADIAVCNQESPSAGEAYGVSGYPSFNAPKEFARDLQKVGCNVIGLANNHLGDKGTGALNETITTWKSLKPLAYSGIGEQAVSYFEVEGFTFAFLAFTDHQNRTNAGVYSMTTSVVEPLLKEASKKADFVIVNAHWGSEINTNVLQSQKTWAKKFADLGADAVFGSGPHVVQGVEVIGNTTVWYSLGNMLSTQLELDQLVGGFAVMDFDIAEGKLTLTDTSFVPTYMHYEWTASEQAAQNLLARKNLKLYPLHSAQDFLARTRFSATIPGLLKQLRTTLEPQAKLVDIKNL